MDTQAETRLAGKVKWFDPKRGYGFITADNQDYFAHVADIVRDFEIMENDEVSFVVGTARTAGARP